MSHDQVTTEVSSQHPPSQSPTIPTPHILHSDIPYTQTNPHPRQVLDIYIPAPHAHVESQNPGNSSSSNSTSPSTPNQTNPPAKPLPLILYVHGGAFKYGDKCSPFLPHRQLSHNYAIAAINYRRSGEALFPAMIQDCKSALRFLRSPAISSRYKLDPQRVVIWGESAGGHAAAFCGATSNSNSTSNSDSNISSSTEAFQDQIDYTWDVGDHLSQSSAVQGVVDYYGPTDFLSMDAHLPAEWATHNGPESPESLYLGGQITREDMREKVRTADPVTYIKQLGVRDNGERRGESQASHDGKTRPPLVSKSLPKFFVAHGTEDRIVPEFMSTLLVGALEEVSAAHGVDVEVEYLPVKRADHGFRGITEEQQRELDERTDTFLKRVFGE